MGNFRSSGRELKTPRKITRARPITRLADISYRPFSTDELSAINKNVAFTILLINARFFGAFACAVAHTFKHENDALERACTHTQMTTSRTFKFSEYMHINVWNKNMPNNCSSSSVFSASSSPHCLLVSFPHISAPSAKEYNKSKEIYRNVAQEKERGNKTINVMACR